ncbi:MAG: vanadium-dependent haloperoxidase [Pseudomonadota bacterium]
MTYNRREESRSARINAAEMAFNRNHEPHAANGDEQRYASANYAMSFTKGLEHDYKNGLIKNAGDFEAFRLCVDEGFIDAFTTRVPVPSKEARRKWEAPTAGVAYDLQGPDAQAVTMAPAPALCSDELAFEMAEVYELALLRDEPFNTFDSLASGSSSKLAKAINRLNALPYATSRFDGRPRITEGDLLTPQTVFRGSSPGVEQGPYLSQFMLIGNTDQSGSNDATDGNITYGPQQISQKVLVAKKGQDYMDTWKEWLRVQDGYDVNAAAGDAGQEFDGSRRFIHTPRDLATYVHYDALYQAYLNACLIMLANGTPFDPAFDSLSGVPGSELMIAPSTKLALNAGGFALYGGPHILTLVTEVATRALKAVRYQKFNNHIRLRPETLAGRITMAEHIDKAFPSTCGAFTKLRDAIKPTLHAVKACNPIDKKLKANYLLPMAFREGSPMHPAYGAGHATVAGACVTILKAFFDTSAVFGKNANGVPGFYAADSGVTPIWYDTVKSGTNVKLRERKTKCPLTLEGELNKLAANISIGRNMAGVHYFTDYYDSARMGEEIAIGMLEEQSLCYPTDPVVMSIPTFDGDVVRIGAR